jgi:DNA repair protein RecO (recombination protein O)
LSEQNVTGIVLRRRDSGESDRRLTLLTREIGKVDVIAKGARKPASRLKGVTEPFSIAEFSLASGKRGGFVTQAQPLSGFRGLRTDFERLNFALALGELFATIIPFDEPNEQAFELLFQSLRALELHAKPIVVAIWTQVVLLELSGVPPRFDGCLACGAASTTAEAYVSPSAGGLVCPDHAHQFSDRFVVRHEVLVGLTRIGECDLPPDNLRFGMECLAALFPFWRAFADSQLPANEALFKHLHT